MTTFFFYFFLKKSYIDINKRFQGHPQTFSVHIATFDIRILKWSQLLKNFFFFSSFIGKMELAELERIRDHLRSINTAQKYDNPDVVNQILDDFESIKALNLTKDLISKSRIAIAIGPLKTKPKSTEIRNRANQIMSLFSDVLKNSNSTAKRPDNNASEKDKEKYINNFQDVLSKGKGKGQKDKVRSIAIQIVEEIFKNGSPKNCIILINALDDENKNEKLHLTEYLLSGRIRPSDFAHYTLEDLMTEEEKVKLQSIREENMNNAQVPKPPVSKSAFFICRRCKSDNVSFYQLQTRSADEPMTTFCTCSNCGLQWRE